MVGEAGLEPAMTGIKTRRLTNLATPLQSGRGSDSNRHSRYTEQTSRHLHRRKEVGDLPDLGCERASFLGLEVLHDQRLETQVEGRGAAIDYSAVACAQVCSCAAHTCVLQHPSGLPPSGCRGRNRTDIARGYEPAWEPIPSLRQDGG